VAELIRLKVFRFDSEEGSKPFMQDYTAPVTKPGMKLLDALNHIKWHVDGTLTYRRSCGEGVCGSDGMNINGVNGLACITPVAGLKQPIRVRPLPGMDVIRDLLQADRWIKDSRDESAGERLDQLEDAFRLYRCHQIMNCMEACPKELNPTRSIDHIKRMLLKRKS